MEDLSYEERIAMSSAWLLEHQGELVPCKQTLDGKTRIKTCEERQRRYPKWIKRLNSETTRSYRLSPALQGCRGCERFDEGEPPEDGLTPFGKPKRARVWNWSSKAGG